MNDSAELIDEAASLGAVVRLREGEVYCVGSTERLGEDLLASLRRNKADIRRYLRTCRTAYDVAGSDIEASLPVGPLKGGILYDHSVNPTSCAYNMGFVVHAAGVIDPGAWERAWRQVVANHCNLRSLFVVDAAGFRQLVLSEPWLRMNSVDLRGLRREEREAEAERLLDDVVTEPFDLSREIPIRLAIIRIADDEFRIAVCLHHISCDADSLVILIDEVRTLYSAFLNGAEHSFAVAPAVPDLVFSIQEYAWSKSDECRSQLDEWCRELGGAPPLLPPLSGRSGVRPIERIPICVPSEVASLVETTGYTAFQVHLVAFARALAKLFGQHDVTVGVPCRVRSAAASRVVDCLLNLLPIRLRPLQQRTAREALAATHGRVRVCQARDRVPYGEVRRAIATASRKAPPEIGVVLTFVANRFELGEWPGVKFHNLTPCVKEGKFALNAQVHWIDRNLHGHMEFVSDAIGHDAVESLVRGWLEELMWVVRA